MQPCFAGPLFVFRITWCWVCSYLFLYPSGSDAPKRLVQLHPTCVKFLNPLDPNATSLVGTAHPAIDLDN